MKRHISATLGALLLVLTAIPGLSAQRIRVRLSDSVSGRPIGGALVSVMNASGAVVRERIADSVGRQMFSLDGPGSYTVRVRRIGYSPYVSPPLELGPSDTRDVDLRLSGAKTLLPTVSINAQDRGCRAIGGRDASSLALWDDIETALSANAVTSKEALLQIALERFEQTLDRGGKVTARSTQRMVSDSEITLFATQDPDVLSRRGYVVRDDASDVYYGPDAAVLLSESFARDHCFGVTTGTGLPGQIGLTFSPAPGRRIPDISGTLWVDSASRELRFLEYRYVNRDLPRYAEGIGGRIFFERLASGAWLVSDWVIRAPLAHYTPTLLLTLDGYRETGGRIDVVGASPRAAAVLATTSIRVGRVTGVVFDSLLSAPLAGAVVSIGDVARATTDSSGRFAIDSVGLGPHEIAVSHPALDSIGLRPAREVDVEDSTVTLTLATPSLATVKAASGVCADTSVVVAGHVRDAESLAPLRSGVVEFSWVAVSGVTTGKIVVDRQVFGVPIDSTGLYLGCIATRGEMNAVAHDETRRSGRMEVQTGPRDIAVLDLIVGRSHDATLRGVVRDTAGRPLVGAMVTSVETRAASRTDLRGEYELRDLPAGSSSVDVAHIGYAAARFAVVTRAAATTTHDLRLQRVVALAPVNIKAASSSLGASLKRDWDDRRKRGWGYALGIADIAKLPYQDLPGFLQLFPSLIVSRRDGGVALFDPAVPSMDMLDTVRAHQGRKSCPVNVYIDGLFDPTGADRLLDFLPGELAGLEYFPRPSDAPAKYALRRTGCGILLIWTKRPGWGR